MRGTDRETGKLFSYASPESLVPHDHPLRAIRLLVNAALDRLSPAFQAIYAAAGRPSIAPERLLRALLLQALFTVRSELQPIGLRHLPPPVSVLDTPWRQVKGGPGLRHTPDIGGRPRSVALLVYATY